MVPLHIDSFQVFLQWSLSAGEVGSIRCDCDVCKHSHSLKRHSHFLFWVCCLHHRSCSPRKYMFEAVQSASPHCGSQEDQLALREGEALLIQPLQLAKLLWLRPRTMVVTSVKGTNSISLSQTAAALCSLSLSLSLCLSSDIPEGASWPSSVKTAASQWARAGTHPECSQELRCSRFGAWHGRHQYPLEHP